MCVLSFLSTLTGKKMGSRNSLRQNTEIGLIINSEHRGSLLAAGEEHPDDSLHAQVSPLLRLSLGEGGQGGSGEHCVVEGGRWQRQ